VNFLDVVFSRCYVSWRLVVNREPNKMSIDIYRKPTYTEVIIPNDSCHSREHKMAAINFLYSRMNTYQLSPGKWQKERYNIQQILKKTDTELQS